MVLLLLFCHVIVVLFFQYKVSLQDVGSRTLWVSVWDWDRFGRNQFLGEVRLPLASLDLTDVSDHWHNLQDQASFQEFFPPRCSVLVLDIRSQSLVAKCFVYATPEQCLFRF